MHLCNSARSDFQRTETQQHPCAYWWACRMNPDDDDDDVCLSVPAPVWLPLSLIADPAIIAKPSIAKCQRVST